MTITGLIIIPLGLVIILLPWRYSLLALPALATLNSAAVVNIGSFGLQPGYFFGMLIMVRTAVEIVLFDTRLNPDVIKMLAPLLLFTIICFVSIWVGLTFFQGKIMVISSTAGLNLDLAQPYTFQRQNLTQPFYMMINVGMVYALAHQVSRLPLTQVATTLDRSVLGAILFASLVVIWELANFHYGVTFHADFFHSNVGYYSAHGQVLFGEILRASGPFSEPSALAYHFTGFLLYVWYRYLDRLSTGALAAVLLCITVMAASTSTTAYAMLGLFALVVVKDLVVMLGSSSTRIRFSLHHVGAVVLLGIASVCAFVFIQNNWHHIDGVLTRMVLEKQHSGSFAQRTGADMMALDIAIDTGGIGIGLGSHKPNNLVATLLSNTGIAGSLLFGIFVFELLRPRRGTCTYRHVRPFRWMVLGLLCVHVISNPNLNPIILWIGFAFIIGTLSAQVQRPTPRAMPAAQHAAQAICR
jgi:hypothetical protein